MALVKQIKRTNSYTLVKFTIKEDEYPTSSQVSLLGDFNDWQATEMKKEDGFYVKDIKLENGKRYEFRYLSGDYEWFNDAAADDYAPSPFEGIQNSVVDLSSIPQKKKSVKKAVKKKSKKSEKDDLKKIEGIGPKIASILAEKGISTFEKLSKAPKKTLETILKEAGPRFSMHKPTSWSKQAKLAHKGKWDELKKLQEQLVRGK